MTEPIESSAPFIFSEIKERLSYQDTQISMLDTKANFVLAAASALMLAAATVFREIQSRPESKLWWMESITKVQAGKALLVVTALMFGLTVLFAGLAYKVRKWHVSPNPRSMVTDYWQVPLGALRSVYVTQLVFDFEQNERDVNIKARWLRFSFLSLLGVTVAVVMLAVSQV